MPHRRITAEWHTHKATETVWRREEFTEAPKLTTFPRLPRGRAIPISHPAQSGQQLSNARARRGFSTVDLIGLQSGRSRSSHQAQPRQGRTVKLPFVCARLWPIAPTRLQPGPVLSNDRSRKDTGNPIIEVPQCRALPTLHRVNDTSHVSAADDPLQKFNEEDSPPKSRHGAPKGRHDKSPRITPSVHYTSGLECEWADPYLHRTS
jgi:hypothetical protein